MTRYSSDVNAPSGDEGDSELRGVNQWDAMENIPPGQVQDAVNMDFTSGDAVTRGGFVCVPELGDQPFSNVWASGDNTGVGNATAIAYGGGTFVAVGFTGSATAAATSVNGINWALQTTPVGAYVAITYAAGLFVAVGGGAGARCITSPTGVTWTSRTASSQTWTAVAYGAGLFVAVNSSSSNSVMTSPDGVTWTDRAAISGSWTAVTYGDSGFVAVADSGATRVMTSADGITWTGVSVAARSWNAVTWGGALYVAVAYSGTGDRVMTSPDGVTWTLRTSAADNTWTGIVYGNDQFIAVSENGTVRSMASFDGINWTLGTSTPALGWQDVAFGSDVFVSVAFAGTGPSMYMGVARILASGIFSDPNDIGSQWIMLAGRTSVGFYAFGRTSRTVNYASGLTVDQQSTIVQCNNLVYIFRGPADTPLRWSGNWADEFELATGSIPNSKQALYYQNRLWAIVGKDGYYASDVLDFTAFTEITNQFNLSTGDSNFLVTSYPFGNSTILLFKNRSIMALSGVDGSLTDVVASEITRQVGAIGINAVVSVGPDVVYMSDRNINLITLTSTNNSLQHKTLPLSRNIQKIFNRVNWDYGYKVSMGYLDNKLFVALPLDNATACNTVVVYNFVTENWFGEWNFDASLGIAIQNFVIANYLGLQRLHAVTEDGRIFVVGDGQNDISGTVVAEISTSLTTRAYSMGNQNHTPRRLYLDLGTNRPNFSVTAYSEGVSESTEELTNQTFDRSESWIFNDSTYDLTNANDDYNRAGRKDYASGTGSGGIESGSGFLPEAEQEYRLPIMTRRNGRLSWLKVTNSTGLIRVMTTGFEARAGYRNNYIQVL